jgi:hypothetical protein
MSFARKKKIISSTFQISGTLIVNLFLTDTITREAIYRLQHPNNN